MQSLMQRERSCTITKVPPIPGIVFFVNDDLVRVYVKVKNGTGQIKQDRYVLHSRIANSRKIEAAIKKNWDSFFPKYSITKFDFEIVYAPMYGKDVDVKITFAVLFAMWSSVHQIVPAQKTAILLKCSNTGRMSKEEASLRQINVALYQGVENIISWKPKNKAVQHFVEELTLYNTLEELVVDIHKQEKAHYRNKDLDSFRLKLVDVIQSYIPDMTNQRKIQSVLKDCFPDKKKEVNLLVLLLQTDIMEKIKLQQVIDALFVNKYVSIMENDYGIGVDNARYAVHTWCLCYGKYVLDKSCEFDY